jgi:2-dehydro-3-deoxyphosphogluconate aldolase/(4S)-4-hydroxy-2-oxoglutarate aldolase
LSEGSASWLPEGVKVVPVVVIEREAHARQLADALASGGIPCAEITLRTPAGLSAIEAVAHLEHFHVGAGTVLNEQQARDAVAAGARFIVSPGFDEGVWAVGQASGVPVIPGIATATEAQRALNAGAGTVKFFPASTSGGIPALKALSAPFGQLKFMPTGGVTLNDAPAWLDVPAVVAVGGSWLTPPVLLAEGRFGEIQRIARQTLDALRATDADRAQAPGGTS